jgi:ABC-type multidrug transport system permease subunit
MVRAAYLSAASYRVGLILSFVALAVSVVPIYFIAGAVQPLVEESISLEGGEYFGFVIVGLAATYLLTVSVSALPSALGGNLSSGTLEALLVTKTRLPVLLLGMVGYPLLLGTVRAVLLLVAGSIVGVGIAWQMLPAAAVIAALLVTTYLAVGLVAAALVLIFRTSGPLATAVTSASILLGGVYYSTSVIPAWLQDLSGLVPLTYALRAARMLLLGGASVGAVLADVIMLALFAVTLLAIGALSFIWALGHARRTGSLSQY